MAGFGPVTVRRMFGGAGVFRDGVMFALIDDEVLYLQGRSNDQGCISRPRASTPSLTRPRSSPRTVMSYWRAPERCLDDPDEMADWCRKAFAVALKSARDRSPKQAAGSSVGGADRSCEKRRHVARMESARIGCIGKMARLGTVRTLRLSGLDCALAALLRALVRSAAPAHGFSVSSLGFTRVQRSATSVARSGLAACRAARASAAPPRLRGFFASAYHRTRRFPS